MVNDHVSYDARQGKSVKTVVGTDSKQSKLPWNQITQLLLDWGWGVVFVANQNESELASNQQELSMEMAFRVITVGRPGKQTQS